MILNRITVSLLLVLTVLLTFGPLTGCAFFRESALTISQEEVKNVEVGREVAANFLQAWPLQSGLIRGALGTNINRLPAEAVQAMDELDELSQKIDELTDQELGYSLGLRVRILSRIVVEALRLYAPDVVSLIGTLAL